MLAAVATALTSGAALARGGHGGHGGHHHGHGGHHHSGVSLGFVFGGPLWYPAPAYAYPYAYPYGYSYSYPPAVAVNPAPRVYIERDQEVIARTSAPGYWYYCRESNVYYPHAKECAGPWERVPARPQTP